MQDSNRQVKKLQSENSKLLRAVEELSVLNELARAIGASHNTEEVMRTIVKRSLRAANAEQGVITLIDKESQQPTKTLVRSMATSSEHEPFHANQSLMGWMLINQKAIVIDDPQNDDRFRGASWDKYIHSLVCVPLMAKSAMIGVLTLYNKKGGEKFTLEDQRLLGIIAGQSAQIIENARLYEEEKALLRIKEELRVAYEIQINLLPKDQPQIPGYDIAGRSIPAQNVGGDYFDFVPVDAERIAICLADVTGKGMPAALLMANLQATIRGQTLPDFSAGPCLERSNMLLYQSTDSQKFATVFYGHLNFRNHTLNYSNAGHNDPYLFANSSEPKILRTGGIMLGALPAMPFEEESIAFNQGDCLVLYSDGITEAENKKEDEFGEERLIKIITQNKEKPANELIDIIFESVNVFAAGFPQSDDMTIVVIKRI